MRFGVLSRASTMVVMAMLAVFGACGGDEADPAVLRVPSEHGTIQRAVDRARAGDLVLIAPGSYAESVSVETPGITIRGEDRNAVVLDGGHALTDGIAVTVDGVAVENLTVRNYLQNGVLFNGAGGTRQPDSAGVYGSEDASLVGYRVSYVTTANNGLYGIYAFAARDGLIEHSYASGHPDSGIYIGQCKPCNAVVTDSIAENNAIGYYGTNASGSVFIVNSVFRRNRLGMTPNSQSMERLAPQVETVIAGNVVVDNDNPDAPAIPLGFFGGGIAIGGGTQNTVLRNFVSGHPLFGIGLVGLNDFDPIANRIEGNVVTGNGTDLYYEVLPGMVATFDNCFSGNDFATSLPTDVEQVLPCDAPAGPVVPATLNQPEPPPDVDHRAVIAPGPQPVMPGDVERVPSSPATAPDFPELDEIVVPPGA